MEELVGLAGDSGLRHVVLTGGEPLLQREIGELTEALRAASFHITMETAGVLAPDFCCDLLSLSPKTSNSDPEGRWARRHRERRRLTAPMRELIGRFPEFQLKFVVRCRQDLPEILETLEVLGVTQSWRVQLMAEGQTAAEHARRAPLVADLCREYGFRYTPRLHLSLFGGGRGV